MKRKFLKKKSKPKLKKRKVINSHPKGDVDDYIYSCSYSCVKQVSER